MTPEGMLLLILPAGVGVLIGYASGGRLPRLAALRVRALWLLWVSALCQAAQYYLAPVRRLVQDRLGVPMLAVTFSLVGAWLLVNIPAWPAGIRLAGGTIAFGAALNGLVIGLDARMPYAPWVAARLGLRAGLETAKNAPASAGTHLMVLGDLIPVAALHKVVSPGNLLIGLGSAAFTALAMRPVRPAREPRRALKGGIS